MLRKDESGARRIRCRDGGARGSVVVRCDFRYRIKGTKTPLAPPPIRRSVPDVVKRQVLPVARATRKRTRRECSPTRVGKQSSVGSIETVSVARERNEGGLAGRKSYARWRGARWRHGEPVRARRVNPLPKDRGHAVGDRYRVGNRRVPSPKTRRQASWVARPHPFHRGCGRRPWSAR